MTWDPGKHPRVPAGQAGGGRWGAARDAQAAQAQKNTGAQHHYTQIRQLPPKQRAQFVKDMSDSDLEALTALLYSYKSSDPDVVQARVVVANEMTKRGIDIKKYGALGGGLQAVKKQQARTAAHQAHRAARRAHSPAPRAAAPAPAAKPAAHSPGKRAI